MAPSDRAAILPASGGMSIAAVPGPQIGPRNLQCASLLRCGASVREVAWDRTAPPRAKVAPRCALALSLPLWPPGNLRGPSL